MAPKSDLPFGSEFSPSQIDLATVLELAEAHQGNVAALQLAIEARFFAGHGGGNEQNRKKLAMNCRLGMKAYGLLDDEGKLTELGRTLYRLRNDPPAMYETLARHILLHRNGMALIQCVRDMVAAGEVVNLTTLRQALAERGIHYPPGGKHPSIMRLWLEKAGVFVGGRWQIDEARLTAILGIHASAFPALAHLTTEQRAFLLALANSGVTQPQPANQIARLAAAVYGVRFPEKSMPKLVLNALVEAGYITIAKTTSGRGAKPFLVQPTEKLEREVVIPLLEQLRGLTDPKLVELLRKSLADVLLALDSDDPYVAGVALEALAFKLMRLLDMSYVATRLRSQSTGGAEVDLIFESARLVYSRWQVQCKNTRRVSLDDVAKEVGLTHFLKSNAIVVVSTGEIGTEARRYANRIMADSNLCVIMLDRADLTSIRSNPAAVVDIFNREARHAMRLKKLDL